MKADALYQPRDAGSTKGPCKLLPPYALELPLRQASRSQRLLKSPACPGPSLCLGKKHTSGAAPPLGTSPTPPTPTDLQTGILFLQLSDAGGNTAVLQVQLQVQVQDFFIFTY